MKTFKPKKSVPKPWKYYRPLVATVLVAGGTFQLVVPVLAQVTVPPFNTAAGTLINNRANATYEDGSGQTINATSNEVTITVAEVAGITVTGSSVGDVNGGTIQRNDVVNYDFTVTNVGNDPTRFAIPGAPSSVAGPGTFTAGTVLLDADNDGTFETPVTAAGLTTGSIAARGSVRVRIPITVTAVANPTETITVVLGNTGANDNSAATQNQAIGTDPDGNDVTTIDNIGITGTPPDASANPPANGEREASASQLATVGAAIQILNGPLNTPNAIGPTGTTNDDFTNRSTPVAANIDPATQINPDPLAFLNTIQNPSATDTVFVSLLPTPPANPADLPSGTRVTISYPTTNATQSAIYEYNGTTFTFISGTGTSADATAAPISATNPIGITLAPSATDSYQISIDLPSTSQLIGYPVPVTAFQDSNNDGLNDATEVANITIDRVYNGYLRLVKESRILPGTGPAVGTGQDSFATTPGIGPTADDVPRTPAPGNTIEYQITLTNISETGAGATGSITLNANNVVITENGTTNSNNWALDNDNQDGDTNPATDIDTSHLLATANILDPATFAGTATIAYSPGPAQTGNDQATDVTQYLVSFGTVVGPQGSAGIGTANFIFQRRVN